MEAVRSALSAQTVDLGAATVPAGTVADMCAANMILVEGLTATNAAGPNSLFLRLGRPSPSLCCPASTDVPALDLSFMIAEVAANKSAYVSAAGFALTIAFVSTNPAYADPYFVGLIGPSPGGMHPVRSLLAVFGAHGIGVVPSALSSCL